MGSRTLREISQDSGIQYHTLYSRVRRFKVPHTRVGNVICIPFDEIEKITQPVGPSSPKSHGLAGSWFYSRWTSLKYYHGHEVCDRWQSFGNFLEDMGTPDDREYRLTKKDVNLGWNPNNCEWIKR